ncbi:MAG TPA: formimidoylglutamate deiminase [Alphaproteobacteria bacterium]|nr:formimidoylglutamate deiminase [Alphaproteobacteria bacterium]
MNRLFAEHAFLPEGWAERVLIEIGADGLIGNLAADSEPGDAERTSGPVIPAMPNLHSHAFQRAMAGRAERSGWGEDSFWSWRQVMYGFVGKLDPDALEAITAQLYVEMLKAGYGSVAEFHYLHHDPEGRPYADPAEMSWRILAAARAAGIALTHLPVLYATGGFGGVPAGSGQRRFLNDADGFFQIVERVADAARGAPDVRVGIAPHSLRAVPPELLSEVMVRLDKLLPGAPVHTHIAEQVKEVEECVAWSGKRPVEWLLDHAVVDERWCLVHATHMTEAETKALARSGAVAGLCPTTEANLGDGFFPAVAYLGAGGRFGIGSDSHISVSPLEELRWLEYGQRLLHRRRNLLHAPEDGSVGAHLWRRSAEGGAQALGFETGRIADGCRADFVVLDADAPTLAGMSGDELIDGAVFAGNMNPVRDVMVGGRWVVREGRHVREAEIEARYRAALARIG